MIRLSSRLRCLISQSYTVYVEVPACRSCYATVSSPCRWLSGTPSVTFFFISHGRLLPNLDEVVCKCYSSHSGPQRERSSAALGACSWASSSTSPTTQPWSQPMCLCEGLLCNHSPLGSSGVERC